LQNGQNVNVLLRSAPNDVQAIAQLLGVTLESDPVIAKSSGDPARVYADFDFLGRFQHLAPEIASFQTPAEPGHNDIDRFNGLPVSAPLTLHVLFPPGTSSSPTTLYVAGDFDTGPARVNLSCGGSSVDGSFSLPVGTVALPPTSSRDCRVSLSSFFSTVYIQQVTLTRTLDSFDLAGRRWLAHGSYRVLTIRRGGRRAGGTVLVDGRRSGDLATIARDGWHTIAWNQAPTDAYLLGFLPRFWPTQAAPTAVAQVASARWSVSVGRASTLEAAVFPDGYWRLTSGGKTFGGHRCDLENTCFDNVPPGKYLLIHFWPSYIKLGFAVTLAAWLLALIVLRVGRPPA
jgi:hypothetical protein